MKCLSMLLALSLLSSDLHFTSASPPSIFNLINPLTQHLLRLLHKREPVVRSLPPGHSAAAAEALEQSGEAFRARRDEPPLSIDLTFHLLRNMIHMARLESQREQALLNRKVLDEVGK